MEDAQSEWPGEMRAIGSSDSLKMLQLVFSDSILIDYDFKIQSVAPAILAELDYSLTELKNQSITALIPNFKLEIFPLLQGGYFVKIQTSLTKRSKAKCEVQLSGFYTGLFTDVNGFILLRCESQEKITIKNKLEEKMMELDHFVYQASHSLRGPLATIRGLINIAKAEKDPQQLGFILKNMEELADRLDAKFYKLMCFAEVDKIKGIPSGTIDMENLVNVLRGQVPSDRNDSIEITSDVIDVSTLRVNEHLIESFLVHFVSFISTLPTKQKGMITVSIVGNDFSVEIGLLLKGFISISPLEEVLLNSHGYGHLLEQPTMTNLFSAQKVIYMLKGKISLSLVSDGVAKINVSIPSNFISLSKVNVRNG